ncbi:MAG: hypothetical protein Kow00117_17790 [Phototrophicales bacterium]
MILITGARGHVGRNLVQQLMQDGHKLRVLLTSDEQLPWDVQDPHAPEIIIGTLMDDEALFAATSGVHVVFHLENAMWWGRTRDLERVELVGTRNLVAAARAARVGRIITLSHLGASPSSAFTLLRIKGQQEALIRDSGLAYTIIRPGIIYGTEDAFVNHLAMVMSTNPFFFVMPGYGEIILHPLYIDDLIKALQISLDKIDTVDEVIEIGGAEYITFEDLVWTIMRVTGFYRPIIKVQPYMMRWLTTLYGFLFSRTLITPQWLDILAASRTAPLGNMYRYFGFQPRRFEDTLMTYLPQKSFFFSALRYAFKRRPRSI